MTPRDLIRCALRDYQTGAKAQLERAIARYREINLADDGAENAALSRSLVETAVRNQDRYLLELAMTAVGSIDMGDEAIHAATLRWKEGYRILRRLTGGSPLHGISLMQAFEMRDASAIDLPDSEGVGREEVKEFLSEVRAGGLSLDDAIAFLKEAEWDQYVDFGLGLHDEFGKKEPPLPEGDEGADDDSQD